MLCYIKIFCIRTKVFEFNFSLEIRVNTCEVITNEAEFIQKLNQAINSFDFEITNIKDTEYEVILNGHDINVTMKKPEWKMFKSRRKYNIYEAPVVAVVDYLVQKFDLETIFDIGAGSGIHSSITASISGFRGVVHAFEMQPAEYEKIETKRLKPELNNRLVAHLAGMSDVHKGEITVWYTRRKLYEENPGKRTANDPWHQRLKFRLLGRQNTGLLRETNILITSVDEFSSSNSLAPDLLKIDVDGYEARVIAGCQKTISKKPFILLELHKDKFLKRFGKLRRDVVKPLFDAGYRAVLFTDHNDCSNCLIKKADIFDPSFDDQRTTMYLFY